jgi:hypothetical protein
MGEGTGEEVKGHQQLNSIDSSGFFTNGESKWGRERKRWWRQFLAQGEEASIRSARGRGQARRREAGGRARLGGVVAAPRPSGAREEKRHGARVGPTGREGERRKNGGVRRPVSGPAGSSSAWPSH